MVQINTPLAKLILNSRATQLGGRALWFLWFVPGYGALFVFKLLAQPIGERRHQQMISICSETSSYIIRITGRTYSYPTLICHLLLLSLLLLTVDRAAGAAGVSGTPMQMMLGPRSCRI